MRNDNKLNQYELILAMTQYMRQDPNDPLVAKLKACTQQSVQMNIFAEYLSNRNRLIPAEIAREFEIVNCPG